MDRAEKKALVETLNSTVSASSVVIVVHYKGLSVAEMTALRGKVRAAGAGFKVAKNRLVRIALKDTVYESIAGHFSGPTALAYANDPVAASKVLSEFAKDNEKLVIIGGAFGAHVLDKKGVEALAKLPSLDELRAKIIALIQTPATRIAGVLQAPAGQLARVVGAHARKAA